MHKLEDLGGGKDKNAPRDNSPRPKFELIQGGKSKPAPRTEIETASDFVVEEGRIFSKEEIMELIEKIAAEEGFKKDQLEITKEIYNPQGRLLALTMKVKSGRTKGEGFGNIWYHFMIKSKHGERFSNSTEIIRTVAEKERPDEEVGVGIVGRYKDGKWRLTPGEFAPQQAADGVFDEF